MYQIFLGRLGTEYRHFQSLPKNTRLLLVSYVIYLCTWPLFGTFINTFLWRQSENLTTLLAYHLGWFVGLPAGFIVNGLFQAKLSPKIRYLTGLIGHAIAPLTIIFFQPDSLLHLALIGLLFGFPGGLFWANKNYLTLALTKGQNRLYYTNLETSLDLSVNTLIPFLIGWFLVLMPGALGYRLVALTAAFILLISAYLSSHITYPPAKKRPIFLSRPTRLWTINRAVQLIYWIYEGLNFILPTILIMIISGSEGIVGSFDAVNALLAAATAYFIGRKLKNSAMPRLYLLGTLLILAGALALSLYPSPLTIIAYSLVITLGFVLRWNPYYTYLMDIIDREPHDNYALVTDNEIFFNLGRLIAIGTAFAVVGLTSLETMIRIVPLGFALLQFAALPLIRRLVRSK